MLLVDEEKGMKLLMGNFEEYVTIKGLTVNVQAENVWYDGVLMWKNIYETEKKF